LKEQTLLSLVQDEAGNLMFYVTPDVFGRSAPVPPEGTEINSLINVVQRAIVIENKKLERSTEAKGKKGRA